jgi:hypothetical protein
LFSDNPSVFQSEGFFLVKDLLFSYYCISTLRRKWNEDISFKENESFVFHPNKSPFIVEFLYSKSERNPGHLAGDI